jgi:hypothetical protein
LDPRYQGKDAYFLRVRGSQRPCPQIVSCKKDEQPTLGRSGDAAKIEPPAINKRRYCFGAAAGDVPPACGGVPQTSTK